MPTNLTGVNAGNDVDNLRVVLDWDASSDNVGVVGYRIDRDGVQVHVVDDGSTDDTDWPRCGHVYDYAVRAYDAAGNLSDRHGHRQHRVLLRLSAGGPVRAGPPERLRSGARRSVRTCSG